MVKKQAVIQNSAGIHVRPTGLIIEEARKYNCSISVLAKGMESPLTDHLGLLSLGLCEGDSVEISVDGDGAEEAAAAMVDLFERHFDFPQQNT